MSNVHQESSEGGWVASLPPSQPGSRRGSMESTGSMGMGERGKGDRLDGVIIRRIWICSKLDREKLRVIWYDLCFLLHRHGF